MTAAFQDLLYLLRCAVQEEREVQGVETDLQALLQTAQKQQLGTVIFPVLKRLYEAGQFNVAAADFTLLEENYVTLLAMEMRRRYAIHKTVADLEAAGFACRLLKGVALAELYPVPEARISGDSDFYIDAEQEEALCRFMENRGFEVLKRPHTSHHAMCTSEATGLMEFHLTLYDALFEDVWFNHPKLYEPYRTYTTAEGHSYTTLGTTDHGIFIALHLIKHFLSKGVGIRQLTDVLLYIRRYQEEMDAEQFAAFFISLGYDKFLQVCFRIGEQYLGFSAADFAAVTKHLPAYAAEESVIQAVLQDMEQGGVFGQEDEARRQFYEQYTKARFARFKQENYAEYMLRWRHASLWRMLFPSRRAMAEQYPVLQRWPVLLPVMYIRRIAAKGMQLFAGRHHKTGADADENRRRIELIQRLDMI